MGRGTHVLVVVSDQVPQRGVASGAERQLHRPVANWAIRLRPLFRCVCFGICSRRCQIT